jgi:uncharacterized protein YijF (DUF1287 family)
MRYGGGLLAFLLFAPPVAAEEPIRIQLMTYDEAAVVGRARAEVLRAVSYDASYMKTSGYPNGDVPLDRGACTDVVIRAMRMIGIDLQSLIHDDIVTDPAAYGLTAADTDVDHRRIPTMFTFMLRNTRPLTLDVRKARYFRPGDIVFFAKTRNGPPVHVGLVSDRIGPHGLPLILQNGGPKATESDSLARGIVAGHFRLTSSRSTLTR